MGQVPHVVFDRARLQFIVHGSNFMSGAFRSFSGGASANVHRKLLPFHRRPVDFVELLEQGREAQVGVCNPGRVYDTLGH